MSAQENAALARRVYDAFNSRDYQAALALASDDVELLIVPFNQRFRGKDGFDQFMRAFVLGFSDISVSLTNQVAGEDQVVSEFIARGTHDGELQAPSGPIAATGCIVEYPVIEVWRVRDGRLATLFNYFDSATLLRQLGCRT